MAIVPPRSGVAFAVRRGQTLRIIDPEGEQVSDLLAYNAADTREVLSSGRSIDYASKIYLTTGDILFSNRSTPMFRIGKDMVGRHDFLLTPCSAEMFRILYGHDQPHRGCFGNLAAALEPFGVESDQIPVAFNVFMNVQIDAASGAVSVEPPLSKAGDWTEFEAQMDMIVALTACSAPLSNNGRFKPIQYEIFG